MPETIDLPGLPPVNRKVLVIGGAAAAGVIGFAWWRAGRSTVPTTDDTTFPGAEEQPTDLAPADVSGVSSGGGSSSTGQEFITTNDQWAQKAVAVMVDLGFDAVAISEALGKYLSNQYVTAQEAIWIQSAIALVGKPPVGEHSIRLAPVSPSPTPTPGGSSHKYVIQVHEFTRDTPVRDAVRRFSDAKVATGNNVQVATVRTMGDPRNLRWIRNGVFLKQHRVYVTVVKAVSTAA